MVMSLLTSNSHFHKRYILHSFIKSTVTPRQRDAAAASASVTDSAVWALRSRVLLPRHIPAPHRGSRPCRIGMLLLRFCPLRRACRLGGSLFRGKLDPSPTC